MTSPTRRQALTLGALALLATAPLTHAQATQPTPVLTVSGAQTPSRDFTLASLEALPQVEVRTTTPWSKVAVTYRGPLLRTVLEAAGAKGQELRAIALNDYRVTLPLADVREHNVILATRADGQPLLVRDKGPLFVIYPFDSEPALKQPVYYERSIWQLRRLQMD
jgi:hypothetical protein